MPKSTLYFIFALAIIATLLLGINIGKNLTKSQSTIPPSSLSPRQSPADGGTKAGTLSSVNSGSSTFTDSSCGFSFSYPGGYLSSNTVNGKSVILTDPDDENQQIIGACEGEIPKPPIPAEKIESIIVDGVTTNLYHDADSQTGKPRDEIIVKHPTNGKEIILAGYGADFDAALSSFRFIR